MEESTKKRQYKSPELFTYGFVKFALRLLAPIFLKLKIERDSEIRHLKGPIVAIGTHSCLMDVAFSILSINNRRLNVICGRDVLSWKWLDFLRKGLRMIPINQYEMDLTSIKDMKKAIDDGCSISLFPEGKISLDGRNLHYLTPSTAKLMKFFGANIVFSHSYGGFCSRPRWYHGFKKGKVHYKSEVLFTKEELADASCQEVYDKLKEKFTFNDNLFQIENGLRYRSKSPAKGLDYLLYKCPKCGAEYEMDNDGWSLTCKICGNKVNVDEYGHILPDSEKDIAYNRVDLWYDFEKESVRKELLNPEMELKKDVEWKILNYQTAQYESAGEGVCFVNHEYIGFEGKDLEGNEVSIKCPMKNLYTIIIKNEEGIDLTIDHVVHRFYFKEKKYSVKYNLIVEENFRKLNNIQA
ncbi:MAG: 2-acyl-glycerophospho-ethanolamine acyltransferase [Firmicutes bacterium ADurb.Bin080]|nr:MAG: 2-acyl-glycerophospho-ethanolamine acyltransferase [Firmicutes bacterium ADurb.Bin080]